MLQATRFRRKISNRGRGSGDIRLLYQQMPPGVLFDIGRSGDLPCRTEASGIEFEAREVESTKPPEPRWKIWRVTWSHEISWWV